MTLYRSGLLSLEVRDDAYHRLDCHVVVEVQQEYFPTLIDLSRVRSLLDIGANIGAYSCLALVYNPAMQVIAVEVESHNFELLTRNVGRYGNDRCRMLLARCGYDQRLSKLVIDPTNSGAHRCVTRVKDGEAAIAAPVRVSVEELLGYTDCHGVDLLKIDCEGGETDILLNMPSITFERIGMIVGEWHMSEPVFRATIGARLSLFYDDIVTRVNPENAERGVFLARNS